MDTDTAYGNTDTSGRNVRSRPRTGDERISDKGGWGNSFERPHLTSTLEAISLVVGPTTLLTALLFYFGWVSTNARMLYFGIDPSILGFSTQDYILRSIDVFFPLSATLVLALVLVACHRRLSGWIEVGSRARLLRVLLSMMAVVGLVGTIIGVAGLRIRFQRPAVQYLALALGPAVLTYSRHMRAKVQGGVNARGSPPSRASAPSRITVMLVCMLVILGLFATFAQLAKERGKNQGRELYEQLASRRPGAVVFSKQRLHLSAPGVTESEIGDEGSAYRFRYTGLRLYLRSGGKYILFPDRWSPSNGSTIVLPDTEGLRLELTPPEPERREQSRPGADAPH